MKTTGYQPPVRTYAGIRPVHSIYLINDHTITLPRGQVVILYGPGGIGKGRIVCNFAGRNSRGENASGEPGTTIMITPEDDSAETVAWRLRAERADLDRVIDMTTLDGGAPFRLDAKGGSRASSEMALARAASELRDKIDQLAAHDDEQRRLGVTDPALLANPTLVIIEPLLAVVGAAAINSDSGARHVLAPLQKIAEETGVTVLITHHSTKGGGDVAGSRAIINAPRVVYEMSRDPDHAQVAMITLRKGNSLAMDGGSRFMIDGAGTDARVMWAKPRAEILADQATAIPAWRMRALAGPLTAIDGAQTEPVPDFARMSDADRLDHLEQMHGMRVGALRRQPGYLRETLVQIHGLRPDDAMVPHRHAAAGRVMLALPAGAPAGEDDTTREPRKPAVAEEAPPVPDDGAGEGSAPAPSADGGTAPRGTQQPPPPVIVRHPHRKRGRR